MTTTRIRLILLIPGLVFFVSCFQIIEDVTVKGDGSGVAVFTANLSQSKSRLVSVMLLDSVNGYKVPSKADVRKHLAELSAALGKIDGISNVTQTVDFDKFIAVIRFSFADVDNLNRISDRIYEEMKLKPSGNSFYAYSSNDRTFTRKYVYEPKTKVEFDKLKEADKAVFKSATYTSIYRFDQPVATQSNTSAKIAASRKAVMLQSTVLDLIAGKKDITNHIQLIN
ncbi:hypothetical protein [Parapedobacter sp. 2B3]|uniref:hypothetical protein n=1 Tax=Parapedobacter sp. 2B3 TaxID=3342381 RepID=UPI0035B5828C